jgi:hypothetical protein
MQKERGKVRIRKSRSQKSGVRSQERRGRSYSLDLRPIKMQDSGVRIRALRQAQGKLFAGMMIFRAPARGIVIPAKSLP